MYRFRGRVIPLVLTAILMVTTLHYQMPEGIMTGPVVTVDIAADMVHAGGSIGVIVEVEDFDGESYAPMDLVEVTLSAEIGSFTPETATTDVEGVCYFEYFAPEEVDGPTDVTITATAEQGAIDPTGSDEVKVTYHLEGIVTGPTQVLAGGKSENYILQVTAGGQPVSGINVMPTVIGSGTLGTYSRQTNSTGQAILTVHPGSSAGQISMIVQINSGSYFASAASKAVHVVEELAPLEVQIDVGNQMYQWGVGRIHAKVVRGADPVAGIDVLFRSSLGYFLQENVQTDQEGNAKGFLLASHGDGDSDYEININITASDGIETAYIEGIKEVSRFDTDLDLEFSYYPPGGQMKSQLFPGEQIFNQPRFEVRFGYVADMKLKFVLTGEENYTRILAEDISTFDLMDGSTKDVIYDPGLISLYTVPEDPIPGRYRYQYVFTDRTGEHVYASYGPYDPYDTDRPLFITIHDEGLDDWTFMYYLAGDNDLAPYMDHELERLENEAPNGEFKVYVFFDRNNNSNHVKHYDGQRWWGSKSFDLEEGRESGGYPRIVTSSSAVNLYRFMTWVADRSPSGHYGLVLSDHGMGYKGMCHDLHRATDPYGGYIGSSLMSLDQIRLALEIFNIARRKAEVVTLAACGMAGFEMASILSSGTDYIVASELPTYPEHGLATEKVLEHLKGYDWNEYSPTPFQVAVDFVNGFVEESGGTQYDSSVCVMETVHVKDLMDDLNSTLRLFYYNWELLGECFSTAFDETTRVPGPELGEMENGDLREFLVLLRNEASYFLHDASGRAIYNKLGSCIDHFDDIIEYAHLTDGLSGMSLYMPTEPIPTDLGIYSWDYLRTLPFDTDYYTICLMLHSGLEYNSQDQEDDFTPLEPVDGHIIDDDGNGLGNRVVINLTPDQEDDRQIVYRVVIDCLQFSGKGGGYLSDMLMKRLILDHDDIEGRTQIETTLPVPGWYTIIARVLNDDNEIVQKFIVGNYTMESSEPEGGPPSLMISSLKNTMTVGDEIEFEAEISDPDGDDVDIVWDHDHRDGFSFDSFEEEVSVRYFKPGNATITCTVTDGEHTVVETIDIVVEPSLGNNAPTAGLSSEIDEQGVLTLSAGELSSDPDDDMLLYKFNFGDGNWTDWIEDGLVSHHYSQNGTYNCSVRVMDIRGSVSNRSFLIVEVESVSDIPGDMDDDDDDNDDAISSGVSAGIIIAIMGVFALVLLAILAGLIFFVKLQKKKEDVDDDDDDEETW